MKRFWLTKRERQELEELRKAAHLAGLLRDWPKEPLRSVWGTKDDPYKNPR